MQLMRSFLMSGGRGSRRASWGKDLLGRRLARRLALPIFSQQPSRRGIWIFVFRGAARRRGWLLTVGSSILSPSPDSFCESNLLSAPGREFRTEYSYRFLELPFLCESSHSSRMRDPVRHPSSRL